MCAAAGTQVWFEYVPSGANIADLPSRDDFELLAELGSVPFDIKIQVATSWTTLVLYDTLVDAWERAAPRRPSSAGRLSGRRLSYLRPLLRPGGRVLPLLHSLMWCELICGTCVPTAVSPVLASPLRR